MIKIHQMKNLSPPLILSLLLGILFSGCNPAQPDQNEIIDLKPILSLEETKVNMSEFIKDFEYFRPEAKPGSFFSLMGILHVGPEIVVLYEKKTQQASIFSRAGKYIGKLGEVGKGPGEYKSASGGVFVFNKKKEIHISDKERKRLLRFNFDGKFLGAVEYTATPRSMTIYQDEYYLCAYSNQDIIDSGGKDLVLRDPETFEELDVLYHREDITDKKESVEMPYSLCFFRKIGEDLLFFRTTPAGDIVYEIRNKKVNPIMTLKFGELPLKECLGFEGPDKILILQVRNFGNYLQFAIQKDYETFSGYLNWNDKSWSSFKFINDLDKGLDFYPMGNTTDGGYFSDDFKIHYFTEFWEEMKLDKAYKSLDAKYPEREKWLEETIPTAQDDNPWIMLVYPDRDF